jgi:hypothetical protein
VGSTWQDKLVMITGKDWGRKHGVLLWQAQSRGVLVDVIVLHAMA